MNKSSLVSALFATCAVGLIGLPACVADDPSQSAPSDGLRLFVMGHSFHIFVADRLAPLAEAAGISGHELLGRQMIGGSSVRQHWDLPNALATYCNFACLYGRSPVGLDDGDRQLDGIHPELRPFLQQIAWDAVTANPLSGVTKAGFADPPARTPVVK